jgi:hypothetical protein
VFKLRHPILACTTSGLIAGCLKTTVNWHLFLKMISRCSLQIAYVYLLCGMLKLHTVFLSTQVSPYFFVWATRAAKTYYVQSELQRELHLDLLLGVRAWIKQQKEYASDRNASNNSKDSGELDPLKSFVKKYAGQPMLYGVCLQKQHLDASHYPVAFSVRNSNRPFLYRYSRIRTF